MSSRVALTPLCHELACQARDAVICRFDWGGRVTSPGTLTPFVVHGLARLLARGLGSLPHGPLLRQSACPCDVTAGFLNE